MIGLQMTMRRPFSANTVKKAVNRAEQSVHTKFGGKVRLRAMHSIRKRIKVSEVGQAPSSHGQRELRKGIRYAVERGGRPNVVIGPVLHNVVYFDKDRKPVRGTVPKVLEEGGEITLLEVFKAGRWRRADLRSRRRLAEFKTRYRKVAIQARPFMGPAFEREKNESLKPLWAGAVRAG